MLKNIIVLLGICWLSMPVIAEPADPKYCDTFKQIHKNMNIGEVFILLGPPSSFGQPPNLNMQALTTNTPAMQPQANVQVNQATAPATSKEQLLKSIATDPILGAFMNAPADYDNVLIWQFDNNAVNISVTVKGPIVTDVKANFTCS